MTKSPSGGDEAVKLGVVFSGSALIAVGAGDWPGQRGRCGTPYRETGMRFCGARLDIEGFEGPGLARGIRSDSAVGR